MFRANFLGMIVISWIDFYRALSCAKIQSVVELYRITWKWMSHTLLKYVALEK